MQLNIYLISHPIIQILSNNIIYNQINEIIQTNNYQKLGILLIYETTRKWIKTNKVYIQKFDYIKEIPMLDSKDNYCIFANLEETYKMLIDIKSLIPKIEIINFTYEYQSKILIKNKQEYDLFNKSHEYTKIIILENILQESYIISLIKYLNQYINNNNIRIACIACYDKTLSNIGNQYPELQIYTTKIIK